MNKKKPTLLDWLGLKSTLNFKSTQWFGKLLGFALILVLVVLAMIAIFGLVYLLGALIGLGPYSGDPTGAAIRNIGLLVVAVFGAPLLVWRSIVAQKQVDVSEQGQITDRINKAVEGLGTEKTVRKIVETPKVAKQTIDRTTPNLEVRIGAIYALERIAQDSLRDHIQIMEILCAYVRENAPAKSLEPTEPELTKRAVPRTDIQTAISVIGRRSQKQIDLEWERHFRLDLRSSDFSGVDFRNGDFSAAMLHNCRIEAAFFRNCKLVGSQFHASLLNYSEFFNAELQGTIFDHAIINRPIVLQGSQSETIQMGNICGISLVGADISEINYLGEPKENNQTFGSKDTKLHQDLEFDRKKFEKEKREIWKLQRSGETENARIIEQKLYENDFVSWFPHDSNDMALGHYYRQFMDKLELKGWPFKD